jgi:hypothetical protein
MSSDYIFKKFVADNMFSFQLQKINKLKAQLCGPARTGPAQALTK